MNNRELDELMRSVPEPERPAEYWEEFPRRMAGKAVWVKSSSGLGGPEPQSGKARFWAVGVGLATACVIIGFVLGLWRGQAPDDFGGAMADARRYFQEIAPLFPGQVQSIVFDRQGARLVLAETADVPVSPPVFVRISGPKGVENFVTFSGQQIRVNGDAFEVLLSSGGEVLLVGQQSAWSSTQASAGAGAYRIQAKVLGGTS